MPKSEGKKLTADDAIREAEAAVEIQRDHAYELFEILDRALTDIRRLGSGVVPHEYFPREGPLRYARLGEIHDVIDVILMWLDATGPHTQEEIVKEVVSGGFYARRRLGAKKRPGSPGGPGSEEVQVVKSIEYHLRTVEEKKKAYGKRGARMKIQEPKLRKEIVSGRELIGRFNWTDEEFSGKFPLDLNPE